MAAQRCGGSTITSSKADWPTEQDSLSRDRKLSIHLYVCFPISINDVCYTDLNIEAESRTKKKKYTGVGATTFSIDVDFFIFFLLSKGEVSAFW